MPNSHHQPKPPTKTPANVIIGSRNSTKFKFMCPVNGCNGGNKDQPTPTYPTKAEAEADGWLFTTKRRWCPPDEDIVAVCPECQDES